MENNSHSFILTELNQTLSANDLTSEMSHKVIPVTGFILIISIFGLFGNMLIIIVYSLYYRKSNFRYFVLTLAYIDLLSSVTALPAEAYAQMNWFTFTCNTLCKTKSILNVFTIYSSALTFLFLGYDRYRKICHPFLRQIEPPLAFKLCVGLVVISGILASPTAMFWGTQTYNNTIDNTTIIVTICEKDGIFADGVYPLAYITSIFVFPVCLSMLFTVVFNVMIARKLIRRVFTNSSKKMTCLGCEMETIPTPEEPCLQINMGSQELINDGSNHKDKHPVKYMRHHSLPAGRWAARRSWCSLNHFDQSVGSSSSAKHDVDVNENGKEIPSIMATIHESRVLSGVESGVTETTRSRDSSLDLGHSKHTKLHLNGLTQCSNQTQRGNGHLYNPIKSVNLDMVKPPKHRHTIHSSEVDITKADSMTLMGLQQWKLWRQHALRRKTLNSRRKTLIMMILSSVFILTMLIYFSLVVLVANKDGILRNMSTSKTVIFFFFWRLYFINSVINPILYGLLDERFRKGLRKLVCNRRIYQ